MNSRILGSDIRRRRPRCKNNNVGSAEKFGSSGGEIPLTLTTQKPSRIQSIAYVR